jgi:hypothetical protein
MQISGVEKQIDLGDGRNQERVSQAYEDILAAISPGWDHTPSGPAA